MLAIPIFLLLILSSANCIDLLGLKVPLPDLALDKEAALTNVLTGSKKHISETLLPISEKNCEVSETKINGGQVVCSGVLLFEDNFNSGNLNTTKWVKQQFIPYAPDYEFVSYEKRSQNCFINNGILNLKATMRADPFISQLDLSNGCTGQNCTANAISTMIPPIVAGKIKSKFSFLYGKIEIRAQLPQGDWIYPQIYLEPKGYGYGEGYKSGRMWIAYSRGNLNLMKETSGEEIGNTMLYSGAILSEAEPSRTYATHKISNTEPWGDEFHIYSLIWTPDGLTILVDGKERGFISPPFTNSGSPYSYLWSGDMSPFDQEFVVTLGIGVGGFSDFPDGSISNKIKKPWKKTSARATLLFFNSKNIWYPSWKQENSNLKIDYVKIWSL